MLVYQEAHESRGTLGSLPAYGRHLPQSPDRPRTTHTLSGGGGGEPLMSLMSVRDEKDSGYVGSTSSRQAALSHRNNPDFPPTIKRRCVLIIVINCYQLCYFSTPVLSSRGMKKLRCAMQKVQKSSWNKPYSCCSSQNCHVVRWHCTAESKRGVMLLLLFVIIIF